MFKEIFTINFNLNKMKNQINQVLDKIK